MNFIQIAQEVLQIEANELIIASNNIDEEIEKAVEIIYKCKGKLIVTGVGKSGLIGSKLAATFASTGTSSFFLHPTEAMHGDLGMIGRDDVVLAISYSGESEELISILPHIKKFDIPLIGMAKTSKSSLGKNSDIFLSINVTKEACPLNAAPTSSTTLTLALGDALAVCLMKKRDFKANDFAYFHPGGSLGKRLFVKVKDLAQSENLPIIDEKTTIKDALTVISEGRLGNVLITKDGKLQAVLSDGDLRRALMRVDFSLDSKAISYATKNPKTLDNEDILAYDALKLIEDYKIQLLVVVDKEQKPKSVLHIHKLIEAGIKN